MLAGAWIVVSDRLAGARADETAKGLLFVAVTGVLLFLLARGYEQVVAGSRRTLEASEQRFRTVVANSPVIVAALDPEGIVTLNAGRGAQGATEGELVGQSVFELYADQPTLLDAVRRALAGEPAQVQVQIAGQVWDLRYQPVVADGTVTGAIAVGSNVTAAVRASEGLARSETRYRRIVETMIEGIVIVDRQGTVLLANPQLATILGLPLDELVGRSIFEVLDGAARETIAAGVERRMAGLSDQYEVQLRRPDGQQRWVVVSASPLELDGERYALGTFLDISGRRHAEAELERRAMHDELTGLANRTLLSDRIEQALARAARHRLTACLLQLDLDQFKLVNDSYGPAVGDQLLIEVARRLQQEVSPEDTVARLGGDEFCVLTLAADGEDAIALAGKVLTAVSAPVALPGGEEFVSASIGVATSPVPDADSLLANADAAMYRAKQRGGSRVEVHDEQLRGAVRERLRLRSELVRALGERQFEMHYQPVVCLGTGAVVGVEALLRWRHPARGLLEAGEFIGVAEDAGLTDDLAAWVIREACAQAAQWNGLGPGGRPLRVSVNVSPRQLAVHSLVELVTRALAETGAPPSALLIEVTEHAVTEDAEQAAAVLRQLASSGVAISIDDFGTGYSSMTRLIQFPISELKIDRSFVSAAPADVGARAVITAVLGLAEALGLGVVGEGVETPEQQAFLLDAGCPLGQGWIWAPALPADQVAAFVAAAPDCSDPGCPCSF